MNPFMLKDAIASVALSHEEGHGCDACLATAGDTDAFRRIALHFYATALDREMARKPPPGEEP